MRRLIAWELLSLDGVMEAPEEWAFAYADDEMMEANAAGMTQSGALMMGRVTYEGMAAHWPHQPDDEPMVAYLNSVPKLVVSGTLEEPLGWTNSTLIKGDLAREISALKQQPGGDITILGSGALVRALLRDGLLDELTVIVHPVILGGGKRLFEEDGGRRGLTLVDSTTFGTGVVTLVYRPEGGGEG